MDLRLFFILAGLFCTYCSGDVFSERCRARCFAEVTSPTNCSNSTECLACLRPCEEKKKRGLPCSFVCGFQMNTSLLDICRQSCKFLKHLQLEDGTNSSSSQVISRVTPPPPWNFHVRGMWISKGQVGVDVGWKKPNRTVYNFNLSDKSIIIQFINHARNQDLPVHRYKLAWSKRLDGEMDEFFALDLLDVRIPGNEHQFTLKGFQPNTSYFLEIQAIIRKGQTRLRSKWVNLTIRTPPAREDLTIKLKKKKKKKDKKKEEIKMNSPIVGKKIKAETTTVTTTTTIPTIQGTNQSQSSSVPTHTTDPPNVGAQKGSKGAQNGRPSYLILLVNIVLLMILHVL